MDRIVDIATEGRHLALYRGFMVVKAEGEEVGRIALDDIHALIVHAHGTTWSANLVAALAQRGAPIVFCGTNHSPVAVTLPLEGHHAQGARMQAQWNASRPLAKQLWRLVVMAKVRNQPPCCRRAAWLRPTHYCSSRAACDRETRTISRRRRRSATGRC
ncbi:CRISPR-associated endonuclease Cas1 [Sphingomonas sp.]|jgi:CRISPR-associated protein Cas1|uniref:CRISPR-associated endonuclease Cas1 n=1 Tax=Sphingomonas sp. TaxID=28214 RepID=UPI002DE94FEE|nr:CRISPR-associated endonuclease Cas1 [Sphingomonas sp.]HEV2569392.1 CRISPR-associated endonuclease Cas1 [Sphingomonas sp.]